MKEADMLYEALRVFNQTELGGPKRFLYSSELSGPDGELPVEALEVEIPISVAAQLIQLRDAVAELSVVPDSFSIAYSLKDVGIAFSISQKIHGEENGVSNIPRTSWDVDHSPIVVELAEIYVTKKEGVWIQLLTEGPSVVQMHISRVELEAMAEPLTKKRPRM